MTFEHLRSFVPSNSSTRFLGPIEQFDLVDLEKVSHLILTRDVLVASIGRRVMAWRVLLGDLKSKPVSKMKGKKRTSNAAAKWSGKS